jgi:hypothetical protein
LRVVHRSTDGSCGPRSIMARQPCCSVLPSSVGTSSCPGPHRATLCLVLPTRTICPAEPQLFTVDTGPVRQQLSFPRNSMESLQFLISSALACGCSVGTRRDAVRLTTHTGARHQWEAWRYWKSWVPRLHYFPQHLHNAT